MSRRDPRGLSDKMQQPASGRLECSFLSSCQRQGSPAPSALLCCDVAEKEAGLSALPDMQTHEGKQPAYRLLSISCCVSASHPASLCPCDIPLSTSAGLAAFLPLSSHFFYSLSPHRDSFFLSIRFIHL